VGEVTVKQLPSFKRTYKKLLPNIKMVVDKAILAIIAEPKLGEEKKGDLAGVFVYKFKANQQQMLLAYEWDLKHRLLLALGLHENFYRNLKQHKT
jgi:mRNA interferase RelE/StbE